MRRVAPLIAGIALIAGCGEPVATDATAGIQPPTATADKGVGAGEAGLSPRVRSDLALLRRVTAPFHDFDEAGEAGWSAQITPCMVDPAGAGGMGFHYGNVGLIDGTARVDQPELLLYEPESNGRLRLVAVEYIIPYTFHSRDAAPPVLFGQKFIQNDVFQLWGLHAWVWKDNPAGIFANWNPRVNCDHTSHVMVMSHN
ncbi:MAG: hypothetical protein ACXU9O_15130 [Gemmatimonadaceae bacterium]